MRARALPPIALNADEASVLQNLAETRRETMKVVDREDMRESAALNGAIAKLRAAAQAKGAA